MFSFQDENQVSVMDTKSPSFAETWGVLEKLVESGKCKNIGLSNFNIAQVIFVMLSVIWQLPRSHTIEIFKIMLVCLLEYSKCNIDQVRKLLKCSDRRSSELCQHQACQPSSGVPPPSTQFGTSRVL